jgi:hypothetical protein
MDIHQPEAGAPANGIDQNANANACGHKTKQVLRSGVLVLFLLFKIIGYYF